MWSCLNLQRHALSAGIPQPNNFDALRLLAACTVLVSHSVPLSYGPNAFDVVKRLSNGQSDAGHLAVDVFFVISGLLITESWCRNPDPVRFVWARAARILPGLAFMLFVVAMVGGAVLTTLPVLDYLGDPRVPMFIVWNLGFMPAFLLPGVFEENPVGAWVNGSLWTLRYEVECYGLVLLLGVARLLTRWTVALLFGAALVASFLWFGGVRLEFASCFLGGACVRLWRLRLDGRMALAALALVVGSLALGGIRVVAATAGTYLVLAVALSPSFRLPRPTRFGDLSYGVYLWAYPVQQVVVQCVGGPWWVNALCSGPVVGGLAWVSWRWVERPALRFRPAFVARGQRDGRRGAAAP